MASVLKRIGADATITSDPDLIAAAVRFQATFRSGPLKIPHMGWNTTYAVRSDPLFDGLDAESGFYFVHSFHLACDDASVVARTDDRAAFVSAVRHENIVGVNFHPEKSHRFGMRRLRNFAEDG
jgi:glutamine amidotransferase